MDPMNSIWYYLEFQRQFSAAKRSSSEAFAKPESRPNKLAKVWLVEPPLALFLFAALVTFGLACFLCPRFLTQNSARACADVVLQTAVEPFRRPELQSVARELRSFLEGDSSGSAQRFEELFLPQFDAAYNLARWIVGGDQDAYVRAMKGFPRFNGNNPRAWLLTIVRNTAYSWIKKKHLYEQRMVPFDEGIHAFPVEVLQPEQSRERRQMLWKKALNRLPPEFREVLVLFEIEGWSYKSIAD